MNFRKSWLKTQSLGLRGSGTLLEILGRSSPLFSDDWEKYAEVLSDIIRDSSFLIVGAGGSIGSAIVTFLAEHSGTHIVAVDLDENGLVELVRDLRCRNRSFNLNLEVYALDCGSDEFRRLMSGRKFDYVLNLSAMKHVRSEQDPYTLSRMFRTNIENAVDLLSLSVLTESKKYFCVSTDKASAPVNLMGASKRLMEYFCLGSEHAVAVSSARFANVAFSKGSLLAGLDYRLEKQQPISVPSDVERFFMTDEEAAILCLFSLLLGQHRQIFFPKDSEFFQLTPFIQVVERYLRSKGLKPVYFNSPIEALAAIDELNLTKKWPVYASVSDTTGEKLFEEFWTEAEVVSLDNFTNIGVIDFRACDISGKYHEFVQELQKWRNSKKFVKSELVILVSSFLPDFNHVELNKNLNEKM